MKLHLNNADGLNMLTAYGDDYIQVNGTRHTSSLVVLPDTLITAWPAPLFESLGETHFQQILETQPELVLLGTGLKHRFPHPTLYACLVQAGIGLEVMNTGAACRTYNILVSEGRRVAAGLIIEAQN